MRPLWYEFPTNANLFDFDKAHMVGKALLVQPVITAGTVHTPLNLPGKTVNLHYRT